MVASKSRPQPTPEPVEEQPPLETEELTIGATVLAQPPSASSPSIPAEDGPESALMETRSEPILAEDDPQQTLFLAEVGSQPSLVDSPSPPHSTIEASLPLTLHEPAAQHLKESSTSS